ncbi:hypothetical protein STENM36S_03177 [Streptomyces tendae]
MSDPPLTWPYRALQQPPLCDREFRHHARTQRPRPVLLPRALLGAELRHAREKSGLSQEELGARLFVTLSFIGQLESGTRRMQPETPACWTTS